jgi:RNA polymerase sigma-70 factor, ECF subfamily
LKRCITGSEKEEMMMRAKQAAENPFQPDTDPDIQLMLQTKNGDSTAFGELFTKHSKGLVAFVYGVIHNRWRAEELVQDAFLQIYRARDRYQPRARFSTYLYRVVMNNCLNEIRRLQYGKTVPEDELPPMADDSEPGPEHYVTGCEMASRMQAILKQLPPNQRAALLLSRVEGFDYREVAQCLGVSEYAVKSLVFRATRSLRDGLRNGDQAERTRMSAGSRSRTRNQSGAEDEAVGTDWIDGLDAEPEVAA